jgi:hypothetical protein
MKVRNPLISCVPTAAYGPSSVFLTLSTVYAFLLFESLFHPSTTSEIYSSRAFPESQLPTLITLPFPLAVYAKFLRFSNLDCSMFSNRASI